MKKIKGFNVPSTFPNLMREQLELTKTQTKLETMIANINNQLNQLMVEQLQLQSFDVANNIKSNPNTFSMRTWNSSGQSIDPTQFQNHSSYDHQQQQQNHIFDITKINKQDLDLTTYTPGHLLEEMEEEEDNDSKAILFKI